MRALLWTVVLLAASAGCKDSARSKCDDVCTREANCASQARIELDRTECIEHCRELEATNAGAALVEEHAACVSAAPTCEAVLTCR